MPHSIYATFTPSMKLHAFVRPSRFSTPTSKVEEDNVGGVTVQPSKLMLQKRRGNSWKKSGVKELVNDYIEREVFYSLPYLRGLEALGGDQQGSDAWGPFRRKAGGKLHILGI